LIMNANAAEILKRLEREAGANLDLVEDFEEVRELVEALEEAMNGGTSPACAAMLMPSLRVGNVVLHRLSHGAKMFFEEQVAIPMREKVFFCNVAYAWCMANAREPERLWEVAGNRQALIKAVKRWSRSVNVSTDVLIDGVESLHKTVEDLYQPVDETKTPTGRTDLGKWIAELGRETGRSVEDLMWRCPEEELIMLLTQRPAKPGELDELDSHYIRAVKRMRDAETSLREKLKERAEG